MEDWNKLEQKFAALGLDSIKQGMLLRAAAAASEAARRGDDPAAATVQVVMDYATWATKMAEGIKAKKNFGRRN